MVNTFEHGEQTVLIAVWQSPPQVQHLDGHDPALLSRGHGLLELLCLCSRIAEENKPMSFRQAKNL